MAGEPQRLWHKGAPLDELVHRFTVGDDPHWDRLLVHDDCLGSAAHARTLARIGLLSAAELDALLKGLAQIDAQALAGEFAIPPALEDCHTTIEAHLVEVCGEAGRKIHTGRSRNDQVATVMRLHLRRRALDWLRQLAAFAGTALGRIERDGDVSMPGYTHMQPAMPSSVGQWLHAFVEAALEQMRAGFDLLERLDCCPLGTGAGFGVPLPLDRAYTAGLLGFARLQRSAIDVQNSRGRMEIFFVRVGVDVGGFIEKFAWDLLLFSTAEFGFFRLPDGLTTGSSIMPQKHNPDVLELLRAKSARLRARLHELEQVAGKLPSSYHRDLQLTKEPALRAAGEVSELLQVAERVVGLFEIDAERLQTAMRPELYATQAALQRAQQGTPFRQAYRQVADELQAGTFVPPQAGAAHAGGAPVRPELVGAQLLAELRAEVGALEVRRDEIATRIAAVEAALLPRCR